jgi:hypothetical protein
MYYPDLSPYAYFRTEPAESVVNVGWLSRDHGFATGAVPEEFVIALRRLVKAPVNLSRGFHFCELCPPPAHGLEFLDPISETIGNGEIRVPGDRGRTLVAPVLVLHYVEAHQYQPPAEFIRACVAR